jgi:phosphoribosylformimino-5-aminoimidazole carboxamide ribotide isomerase
MRFRPCIDIHNGKVKQIVGSSLNDRGDAADDNFVSEQDSVFYSDLYFKKGLSGGHVIMLNPPDSRYYRDTLGEALKALSAHPGFLQAGGGITPGNAGMFLDAGASHVIVTSYVFRDVKINLKALEEMKYAVGKEHLVLDLSCKRKDDSFYIVTDRWQKMTDMKLSVETMNMLSVSCDEFLVHAADVEGKQNGIEEDVVSLLGNWGRIPVTYAGGVHSMEDLEMVKRLGKGIVDVTIGSALEIFGGNMKIDEIIRKM